jgi:DNA polymerase-3 subunit delta
VVVEQFFTRGGARRGRAAQAAKAAQAAADSEDGAEPSRVRPVAEYLARVPASTVLIFVESETPPNTGPVARALESAQVKQQIYPLARWIRDRAKAQGGQIAEQAAHLLADYVGGDLRTLSNEIAKLVTYAGAGHTVEADDVRLLVHQIDQVNIFALVDAVGQGQQRGALVALHELLTAGERPERIMGMLARQVRLLLQARDLADHGAPADVVARTLGLSGFPLRKVQEQARLFKATGLLAMHRRTLEADLAVKTGLQEPQLALELLVTDLTEHVARPARALRPARSSRPALAQRR